MQVPTQVQRQLDEALALEKTMLTGSTPPEGAQPAQPVAATVPDTQPPQPASQAPAPTPAPAEDFEQKYRSLNGKYTAEVPRLAQAAREAAAREEAAKRQLAEAQAELEQLKAQSKPTEKPAADPKDVEDFGLDLVAMVQRQCDRYIGTLMQTLDGKVTAFNARLTAIEQQVTGVSQRTDVTLEQQFYAALKGLVPDWEQINASEKFLAWLAEVDPIYGQPRQAALEAAHQSFDVQRVANVFAIFKTARPAPRATPSLEAQVAPTSVSASAPSAPVAKPLVSQKSVQDFYNRRAQGHYRSNEAEADRIEAEINLALAEGRVR